MSTVDKIKIIHNNNKFGIKTIFYDGGAPQLKNSIVSTVLGYSEGDTIFLNENAEQDFFMTNEHELLHFFEGTSLFEQTKNRILNTFDKEELENLKLTYQLKYFGLYKEQELDSLIEKEIAIDALVGNGQFSKKTLTTAQQEKTELLSSPANLEIERRYLNISKDKKIEQRFPQLSQWEKLFVQNYYSEDLPAPTDKETKYEYIREDIQYEYEKMLEFISNKENFKITTKDNPYLEREYLAEIRALKARGQEEGAQYMQERKSTFYPKMAEKHTDFLHAEIQHIADFISSTSYESSFKYLMLKETLSKVYRKDFKDGKTRNIVEKRELNKSIAGHMSLNDAVLDTIYNNLENYSNFANIYFDGLEKYNETISQNSELSLEDVNTFDKGKWLKFNSRRNDEKNYIENSQQLSSLVQNTPWCTKTLASQHLEQGNFYVFVDHEIEPHVAVKLSGNEIDEVRGLKGGSAQELEDDYREVAIEFLKKNKDIAFGKEWLEKEEWNKRLVQYNNDILANNFKQEDTEQLLQDLIFVDYKAHSGMKNSNKTALLQNLKLIGENLAKHFDCKEHELYFGEYMPGSKEKDIPYKVIIGDAEFKYSSIKQLGNLTTIVGNAYFSGSQINDLQNLTTIFGLADFQASPITSLKNLTTIGEGAWFNSTGITSLGNLKYIGKTPSFDYSNITDLSSLEWVGGSLDLSKSKVSNLGNLKHIGGNAIFSKSAIVDLKDLQHIGGSATFSNSKITTLSKLKKVGKKVSFEGSKVKDLGDLEYIGEDAIFYGSEITDLNNLSYIGGNALFTKSKITNLGNLKSIAGNANFNHSNITTLGNLEAIGKDLILAQSKITTLNNLKAVGGNVDFSNSIVTNCGELEDIGGDAIFSNSKVDNLGKIKTIGKNANFQNSEVTDLGNLKYIGGSAIFAKSKIPHLKNLQSIAESVNFECSNITDLGDLESIGGSALFSFSKITNLDKLKTIGGNANFQNSEIVDLGDLQSIGGKAMFFPSKIIDFGKLESIDGQADFKDNIKLEKNLNIEQDSERQL